MRNEKLLLGYISFLNNDFEAAEKNFREALQEDPTNFTALQNLIITMLREKKIEETEALLQMNQERFKKRTRVLKKIYPLIFLLKLKQGKIDDALEYFEKAFFDDIYISPPNWEDVPSVIFGVNTLFKIDDEILSKYRRWLSHPKRGESLININLKLREAIYFALRKNFKKLTLHAKLIYILIATSIYNTYEAYKLLKELDGTSQELSPLDKILLGKLWYIFGKVKRAYELFILARSELPIHQQYLAYANLALVYYRLGDYQLALDNINLALKRKTDCYRCWYIRAKILMALERWSEAEGSIKLSLEHLKNDPHVWIDLGIVYLNRGKISQGIDTILMALKIGGDREKISLLLDLLRFLEKEE